MKTSKLTETEKEVLRLDKKGIISLNNYDDGWHFTYFPLGDDGIGKYFCKEKLSKTQALKCARDYMREN